MKMQQLISCQLKKEKGHKTPISHLILLCADMIEFFGGVFAWFRAGEGQILECVLVAVMLTIIKNREWYYNTICFWQSPSGPFYLRFPSRGLTNHGRENRWLVLHWTAVGEVCYATEVGKDGNAMVWVYIQLWVQKAAAGYSATIIMLHEPFKYTLHSSVWFSTICTAM